MSPHNRPWCYFYYAETEKIHIGLNIYKFGVFLQELCTAIESLTGDVILQREAITVF